MKTLIDTTCPHCGFEMPLSRIRYDLLLDSPMQEARYVCSLCQKTLKISVSFSDTTRRFSLTATDDKFESIRSIIFSNLDRPCNPFVATTVIELDYERFMSEVVLGSIEHVNQLGDLYIKQSLNQGHLTTNGIIYLEEDCDAEVIAAYRPHLLLPTRHFPDIRLAARFATNLAWLFKYTVQQAINGALLQKADNGKIVWCHCLQSAVVFDYLLRNRWIAQLFNYWYQYVFDYDVEPILYSADGSVWISNEFVKGLDADGPLFLYPAKFRELSFEEAIELVMQDDPVKHHEENSRRFSPDREVTNLNSYGSPDIPTNRVLH